MTITIQGPDGASIDFPDETPESEMNAAMAQAYPEKATASQDPGALANSVRALRMGLPFGNQMVAAEKTLLPESLGGSKGFDYGANLADVNAADAQLQQQHPHLAALGEGATGALGSLAIPGAALGEGAGVIPQVVRGAGAGFGIGALQGAGAPGSDIRNVPETEENAIKGGYAGGALGGALPGVAALAGKAVSPLAAALSKEPVTGVLTADTIGSAKNAAYKAVDELGASYTPEQYKGLVDKITADAEANNISPDIHPAATAAIKNLQKSAGDDAGPISLTQLDQKRQMVGRDVASSLQPGERYFGGMIKRNIDDFIANQEPTIAGGVPGGESNPAADAIQNARDLNTRYAKSQALTEALKDAELRSGSTNSGDNIDNATRQNLRRVLKKGNFTPDETEQYTNAIMGGPVQNFVRRTGKMLNPSGFVGTGELAATIAGEPSGLVAAGIGYGAKKAANRMTNNNVSNLMATILAGGKVPAPSPARSALSPRQALAAALATNANLQSPQQQNLSTR